MKKLSSLFIAILLSFTAIAKDADSTTGKITNVGFINVGLSYPSFAIKDIHYQLPGAATFRYSSYQHLFYFGLGYRTIGRHRSPLGFQGIINFERIKLDYSVQYHDSASQQYGGQRSLYSSFFNFSPGIVFDKVTESGFIFHAALTGSVAVSFGEASYSYGAVGANAGMGYGPVVVNVGYSQALNNIFRYQDITNNGLGLDMDVRPSILTVGLIIYINPLNED